MSPSALSGVAKFDVAILGKGDGRGLPAMMRQIRTLHPSIRVIVTSLGGNDDTVLDALANGVKGYVDEAVLRKSLSMQSVRLIRDWFGHPEGF